MMGLLLDRWLYLFIVWIFPGPLCWILILNALKRDKHFTQSLQFKLDPVEQTSALKTALVDFQKTQCCFNIALQIATFLAISGSRNMINAKSMSQFISSISLLYQIGLGGVISTNLILSTLYR